MWRLFKIYVKKRNQLYLKPVVVQSISYLCKGGLLAFTKTAKLRFIDRKRFAKVLEYTDRSTLKQSFSTLKKFYRAVTNFKKRRIIVFAAKIITEWLMQVQRKTRLALKAEKSMSNMLNYQFSRILQQWSAVAKWKKYTKSVLSSQVAAK